MPRREGFAFVMVLLTTACDGPREEDAPRPVALPQVQLPPGPEGCGLELVVLDPAPTCTTKAYAAGLAAVTPPVERPTLCSVHAARNGSLFWFVDLSPDHLKVGSRVRCELEGCGGVKLVFVDPVPPAGAARYAGLYFAVEGLRDTACPTFPGLEGVYQPLW